MKRKARAYKILDSHYNKAMKRAAANGHKLAQMIEGYVYEYGAGAAVPRYIPPQRKKVKK